MLPAKPALFCGNRSFAAQWTQKALCVGRSLISAVTHAEEASASALAENDSTWINAKPFHEIPGPRPLPFIGNLWRFLPIIGDLNKVKSKDLLHEFARRYGPISIFAMSPGYPPKVILSDADEVEKVYRNEGVWPIRESLDSFSYYFFVYSLKTRKRRSLTAEQGQEWQEFRTSVNQVMMQPRSVIQYIRPTSEVSNDFIDRMLRLRDSSGQMPANFSQEISKWGLESVSYIALDTRLGALDDNLDLNSNSDASRIVKCVRTAILSGYALDTRPSIWKYVSTPTFRRLMKALDELSEISAKYVNNAIARLEAISPEERADRPYSVLERLLLSNDNPLIGVDMAMDMIFAGVDTTSASASGAMYLLASHPEKQRLLQEELDTVIPDPRAPLTKQTLEQLKYLRACIKESLRMRHVTMGNIRSTPKDMVLAGYQIPKGTRILMHHDEMSNSERYVPRADEFLPERWLPGGESLRPNHSFAYLPFGFGPRMCVGRRFAELEVECLIALCILSKDVNQAEYTMFLDMVTSAPSKFKTLYTCPFPQCLSYTSVETPSLTPTSTSALAVETRRQGRHVSRQLSVEESGGMSNEYVGQVSEQRATPPRNTRLSFQLKQITAAHFVLFRRCTLEWHHPPPEVEMKVVMAHSSPLKFTVIDRMKES